MEPTAQGEDRAPAGEPDERTVRRVLTRLGREGANGDRYELVERVGSGGTSVVWRVRDKKLGRDLAMKVVNPPRPGAGAPEDTRARVLATRFLEEAQITSQLDHPGIVPVHDLGADEEGRLYFTMRLVRGRDLSQVLRLADEDRDGWTRTRLVSVLLKACEAVAYAHAKGVIHRDLKPANLMVGRFGEVYVMDWGLAKVLEPVEPAATPRPEPAPEPPRTLRLQPARLRRHLAESGRDDALDTRYGDVFGTPPYMPPEQAWGAIDELGPRADVYSMGAVLYRLLAGRRPYESDEPGPRAQLLYRIVHGPPRPVKELRPDAPDELVSICEKAMARDAAGRYADMLEMAEDLRAYLDGRVVRAHRTGALVAARKWLRRNRRLAGVAGLGLLAVAGIALRSQLVIAGKDLEVGEARDRASWMAYVANIANVGPALQARSRVEAAGSLAGCPEEHRGWEWRYWSSLVHELYTFEIGTVVEGPAPIVCDASGELLATRSAAGGVVVLDARTGRLELELDSVGPVVTDLAFLDEHRLLTGHEDGSVRLWDLWRRGSTVELRAGDGEGAVALAHDVVSDRTLLGIGPRTMLWHWADGAPVEKRGRRRFGRGRVVDVDILATGTRSAFTSDSYGLGSYDFGGRSPIRMNYSPRTARVAFSPDGQRLAVALDDGDLEVADLKRIGEGGWDDRQIFAGKGTGSAVAWHPESREVAVDGPGGSVRIRNVETGEERRISGNGSAIRGIVYLPDGAHLVTLTANGLVRCTGADAGSGPPRLLGPRRTILEVSLHPTESRLAALYGADVPIGHWDTRSGLALEPLDVPHPSPEGVSLEEGDPEAGGAEALSPDWTEWAFAEGAVVRRCALDGERELASLVGHDEPVVALAFSATSDVIASADTRGRVCLWRRSDGALVREIAAHEGAVSALAFDADGARLGTGDRAGRVCVHALGDGRLLLRREMQDAIGALAFGPDEVLAVGSGRSVRLLHLISGASEPIVLEGHVGPISGLAFHPAGDRLASCAHEDSAVRVWAVATGECLTVLRGHEESVSCLRFDPAGECLYTASGEGVLRTWCADARRSVTLWQGARLLTQARTLVDAWFDALVFFEDVVAAIDAAGLSPEMERACHTLARSYGEVSEPRLLRFARQAVRPLNVDESDCRRALRVLEALTARDPENPLYRSALGLGLVRLRRYEEAFEHLEAADAGFRTVEPPLPLDEVANVLVYSLALLGSDHVDLARHTLEEANARRPALRADLGSLPDWVRVLYDEANYRIGKGSPRPADSPAEGR